MIQRTGMKTGIYKNGRRFKDRKKKCQLVQCLQNKGQKKDHCKLDSKNTLKYNDLTFLVFVKIVIKLQFHEAQWKCISKHSFTVKQITVVDTEKILRD